MVLRRVVGGEVILQRVIRVGGGPPKRDQGRGGPLKSGWGRGGPPKRDHREIVPQIVGGGR